MNKNKPAEKPALDAGKFSPEQITAFGVCTTLQKEFILAKIENPSISDAKAYKLTSGKAKTDNSVKKAANQLSTNINVLKFFRLYHTPQNEQQLDKAQESRALIEYAYKAPILELKKKQEKGEDDIQSTLFNSSTKGAEGLAKYFGLNEPEKSSLTIEDQRAFEEKEINIFIEVISSMDMTRKERAIAREIITRAIELYNERHNDLS